jgi:UMF1 family MFS transporter
VFGIVVAYTGSGRQAIIAVLVFFVVGAALLVPVDVASGRLQARAAEEAL